MFKIELENRDFRKSLYFYIVDAEKKKKQKKNELRLGAGIILNQELTYSRQELTYSRKMGCGRLPAP